MKRTILSEVLKYLPWIMVLLAWVYLTSTQSHELLWFDSGELALAGHSLGISHPPGQPLYMLLASLTSWSSAKLWALNHISVISTAFTLYPLYLLQRHYKSTYDLVNKENSQIGTAFLEVVLALYWVSLYPVWDQGTRIEVYALGNLLGCWGLALATLYPRVHQRILAAGICLGLCGSTHPFFAVGYTLAAFGRYKQWLFHQEWSKGLYLSLGMLVGLAMPYIFLFGCAYYSNGFIWGDWTTWESIWYYFSGADYIHNTHSWFVVPKNLISWMAWFGSQGGGIWLLLTLISLILIRIPAILWSLFSLFLCVGIFPLSYLNYWPEIPDFTAYFLPCLSLSLLLVWGITTRLHWSKSIVLTLILISAWWGETNPWHRDRTEHSLPLDLAKDWLESLPEESLLFVESDHWVFPLMYAQSVMNVRSDVLVFNTGFSRSSWYWRWLRTKHQDLPSLDNIQAQNSSQSRLSTLVSWRPHSFTESESLAWLLSSGPSPLVGRPCLSAWGFSVACTAKLPLPTYEKLLSWACKPAHQDPITKKVMARLGLHFLRSLWLEKQTYQALLMGFSALGMTPIDGLLQESRWWPVSQDMWSTAQTELIGDPLTLQALMYALMGIEQTVLHQ